MAIHDVRPHLTAALLLTAVAGSMSAQGPAITAPPGTAGSSHCLFGSSAVRAATGGVLGGWIGFVAAKIKMSDWNDASHSASATRTRNQLTIGGVVLGAVAASFVRVNKNCVAAPSIASSAPRAGRQPITADEISRAGLNGNVYDVIYTLRRNWLNLRGLNSGNEGIHLVMGAADTAVAVEGEPQLVVYLDNVKLGTASELRRLPVVGVTSIRYYDPAEANYLWGMGHTHGAIQVVTLDRQGSPR